MNTFTTTTEFNAIDKILSNYETKLKNIRNDLQQLDSKFKEVSGSTKNTIK
ncbi:hypothetical protein [Chondrinema litorale]|uniref:hypothetical protein n=1 Tax=Chondrinema litorale TaxID=2994555 RepID=UPI002543A0BA|nr:hypothetical protein [Chondrinema litorale]UZR93734.1 hypothetical protein OQ292_17955 [Chondrinema litorale]